MGAETDLGKRKIPWPTKIECRREVRRKRRQEEKKALRKHEEP